MCKNRELRKPCRPVFLEDQDWRSLGWIFENNPQIIKAQLTPYLSLISSTCSIRKIFENLTEAEPGRPSSHCSVHLYLCPQTRQFTLLTYCRWSEGTMAPMCGSLASVSKPQGQLCLQCSSPPLVCKCVWISEYSVKRFQVLGLDKGLYKYRPFTILQLPRICNVITQKICLEYYPLH